MLTTQLNLVPRLRMCGATPLLSPYAFTESTRTTLASPLPFMDKHECNICAWLRAFIRVIYCVWD